MAIRSLMEDMVKEYEKVETYCILVYSTDKARDFKLMAEKMQDYRNKLNSLLAKNGDGSIEQDRALSREEYLPRESIRVL